MKDDRRQLLDLWLWSGHDDNQSRARDREEALKLEPKRIHLSLGLPPVFLVPELSLVGFIHMH